MVVAVDVQAGYPTGNIGAEQGTVTVAVKIPWADVANKLGELFPSPSTAGPGANKLDPVFGFYRCQSVEFKPIGAEPNTEGGGVSFTSPYDATFTLPYYEFAWLTITYSSVQVEFPNASGDTPDTPDGSTDVLGLTHQLSTGGETITLENESLYWSDTKPVTGTSVSAHKIVATTEHNIQWSLVGKVNDMDLGPFQTGTMVEETLLYVGFTATPDITADGTRVWDIGYKFSERRVDELTKAAPGGAITADGVTGHLTAYGGWNHFWKQETPEEADPAGGVVANTKTSGFRRLHASEPPTPPGTPLVYQEDVAIFKKGSLETLFVQV